jgi:hypothetical protein
MQLWKWFSKEEEPEDDPLKSAVEQNQAVLEEATRAAIKAKRDASELVNVSQGALDILTKVERKQNG